MLRGALHSVEYRLVPMGKPKMLLDGSVTVVAALTLRDHHLILINSRGPFMNPMMSSTRIGGQGVDFRFGLSPVDYRALLILHELGHLMGRFKPDGSDSELASDRKNPAPMRRDHQQFRLLVRRRKCEKRYRLL